MIRNLGFACGIALSLAACASANKRYEQGQQLQREGRPAEAAERYIQALKKDTRLDSARAGLRTAGAAAIDQYLRTAAAPSTAPAAAADAYLAADDLQRRSLEVGIFLPPPNGYAANRRAAFDRAIESAVADARGYASREQFAEALSRLQRAGDGYEPTTVQARSIGSTGADIMLAWARSDTAAGRFRAAFTRVERIEELPAGVTAQQIEAARAIQGAALSRGTQRIVVIPPWATIGARNELPEDVLPSLGDALLDNPWLTPPQFVAMVPPEQVERELRRQGLARRTLSPFEAARIGRPLGADFVVVMEIDSVRRDDTDMRITRRPARTTRGVDTAYVIEEGNARLFARATFAMIDRDGQRGTEYQSVTASATSPFTRVRYAGDYRTLDLRQAERELFQQRRPEGELTRAFVAAMSPRLGDAVFAEVIRRIP